MHEDAKSYSPDLMVRIPRGRIVLKDDRLKRKWVVETFRRRS